MKIFKRLSLAVMISSTLSGCAYKNINDTMKKASNDSDEATAMLSTLKETKSANDTNFQIKSGVWVDTKPIDIKPIADLPRSLNCDITFGSDREVGLLEFSQRITKDCGVVVRITPDALAVVSGGVMGPATNNSIIPAPPEIPNGVTLPSVPPSVGQNPAMNNSYSSSGTMASASRGQQLNFEGKLKGLLEVYTAGLGLSYRTDETEAITIFYLDTQTFTVMAMPSATESSNTVKSGTNTSSGVSGANGTSSGMSGDSTSNSTTSVTIKNDLLRDIEKNLRSMLTPNVGRLSMSPSTGNVTITDTPEVLKRVKTFIASENIKITQQVLLNVKILSVSLKDLDDLGLDWNVIYKSMSGKWGINLKNAFSDLATNATSGSISILDPNSQFDGTTMLIKALSEQGKVSVVTSPSITTLNLQPAPVQVSRQTSYLASRSTTSTTNAGTETSLTPGTVTTGFNMSLLPAIIPDTRDLLLQYNINLSSLIQIRKIGTENNQIEMPDTDSRIFSQQVKLRSGETLVISGFEQTADNANKSGVGDAEFWGFGGARSRNSTRDIIVVIITPVLL